VSKLKAGDVVQVLNTKGFLDKSSIGKSVDEVESFLYSIGNVIEIQANDTVVVNIMANEPFNDNRYAWYFEEDNLQKIGVL